MTAKDTSKKTIASLCDEIGPEDGVDPRYIRRDSYEDKIDRKTRQLGKQVAVALDFALRSLGDETLGELTVLDAEPAPDASRFLVLVAPVQAVPAITEEQALAALTRASGVLRSVVADATHRRRTPSLAYWFAPHLGRDR